MKGENTKGGLHEGGEEGKARKKKKKNKGYPLSGTGNSHLLKKKKKTNGKEGGRGTSNYGKERKGGSARPGRRGQGEKGLNVMAAWQTVRKGNVQWGTPGGGRP